MEPTPAPKKNFLIPILIILVGLLVAVILWMLFSLLTKDEPEDTQETSTSTTTETTKVATVSPTTLVVSEEELIRKAVAAHSETDVNALDIAISQNADGFAKGTVNTKGEETGGGYFLAAKVDGAWKVVYSGQATPNCSEIDPYNFPASLVSECLDPSGNLKTR